MKSTGVVRRIDDLGRIVVPKEIRRSLKIRDGESLEIFVDKDIIGLKKYSPMSDLEDFSKNIVESVFQILKSNIIITDRDDILAVSSPMRKKYQGKAISLMLEQYIENHQNVISSDKMKLEIVDGDLLVGYYSLNTIMVNGDPIGLVCIFNETTRITEVEEQVVSIITQFLEKHLEE